MKQQRQVYGKQGWWIRNIFTSYIFIVYATDLQEPNEDSNF